jgi:hypothetical protein
MSTVAMSQGRLARVVDGGAPVSVRSGQGNQFVAIAQLNKDDLFYCEKTNGDWIRVTTLQIAKGSRIEGYIHSKVQFIEDLDSKSQKLFITNILNKHKTLAEAFYKAKGNESLSKEAHTRLESDDDTKYTPMLSVLPKYFCTTKDTALLQQFFATLIADKGSPNETPHSAAADCYVCHPDLVIELLKHIADKDNRYVVISQMELGLLIHFDVDFNHPTDNSEYIHYKIKLDDIGRQLMPVGKGK